MLIPRSLPRQWHSRVVKPLVNNKAQVRFLSLQEHQTFDLLRQHGVPIPKAKLAKSPLEVRNILESYGGQGVIKAQTLKGDRGKAKFDSGLHGGIQFTSTAIEGEKIASQMLGNRLQNPTAGANHPRITQLQVVERIKYDEEWYLSINVDRERYCPVIVVSKRGGSNIENIVRNQPDSVITIPLAYDEGITPSVLSALKEKLSLDPDQLNSLDGILKGLWTIFSNKDATVLELNPLALTSSNTFIPLNAEFTFDDAAARRQSDIFALRDPDQEIAEEVEAEKYGLVYVRMEGTIGNVVNGAGLAMATNDAIGLYGGKSANFLDAGGQATKETMMQAFRIILSDQRVNVLLVNIYGGITKCDMIAKSIVGAASELGPLRVPVVVRLQGTNSAEGLKILEEANLGLYVEAGFGEAAKKAVELSGKA